MPCAQFLKQVIAVQSHAGDGSPHTKTWRRGIGRTKRAVTQPVLREQKPGQRAICRYGTEELRPLPVAEEVISAFALSAAWLLNRWQEASPWLVFYKLGNQPLTSMHPPGRVSWRNIPT
jgi:hypothetical protein